MRRRDFLGALLAGAVMDPERLLWVPGRKKIFIPPAPRVLSWDECWPNAPSWFFGVPASVPHPELRPGEFYFLHPDGHTWKGSGVTLGAPSGPAPIGPGRRFVFHGLSVSRIT